MVSGCSTLPALTQNCRVLIHFADDSGAFLATNLSQTLARIARSKTQEWSLGSLSRGGVVTPDCKARSPVRGLSPGKQTAQASRSDLLLSFSQEHAHRYRTHHSTFH